MFVPWFQLVVLDTVNVILYIIFQGVYFLVQIATNFNGAIHMHFAKPQNINQGIILMRCQPDKRYTFPCLNQPQNHLDVRL